MTVANALDMTIADLNHIPCYHGWSMAQANGRRLPLTPRERQVLDMILGGLTHKETAFDLGVSGATVRVLYSRAMKKLGRRRRPISDASVPQNAAPS